MPDKRWHSRFLEALAKMGNVSYACRQSGIPRATAYDHKKEFPEFAEAWDEALEEAADLLELEARRRAVYGCEKPVFWKGKQCGSVQEYSDTLLIILLKAHRPEKYRENHTAHTDAAHELAERVRRFVEEAGEAGAPPALPEDLEKAA